jgi:hypothetical protein
MLQLSCLALETEGNGLRSHIYGDGIAYSIFVKEPRVCGNCVKEASGKAGRGLHKNRTG